MEKKKRKKEGEKMTSHFICLRTKKGRKKKDLSSSSSLFYIMRRVRAGADVDEREDKEGEEEEERKRNATTTTTTTTTTRSRRSRRTKTTTTTTGRDVVAVAVVLAFFLSLLRLSVRPTRRNDHRREAKVIAIGDVHGDEDVLRRLLFATGVTNKVFGDDVKWMRERNEKVVLVQTGDVVDRGKDSIGSFKFIRDIREQTLANGDDRDEDDIDERQVRLLVGNHELMAIQADYRFIAKEELLALGETHMEKYGEQEKIHPDSTIGTKALQKVGLLKWKKIFGPEEPFGKEIREFGSVITTAGEGNCKSAFAHAGVLPEHLREMKIRSEDYENDDKRKSTLVKLINEHYRNSSKGVQMSGNSWQERSQLPSWINGGNGVFWTREPPDASETNGGCEKIKKIVDLLGVKRMVIGHTVQWQGMNSICDGKLVLIDSGMSYAYGGRQREAFVCKGVNGVPMAIDVNGKSRRIV